MLVAATVAAATRSGSLDAQRAPASGEVVAALQLQPNFYVLTGAGANVAVQLGPDGLVVVDSGAASMSDALLDAIKRLSEQPIRYIINTGGDLDHVGGNEALAKAGRSIFPSGGGANVAQGGGGAVANAISNNGGASIVGTEGLLARMSAPTGAAAPFPTVALPTETFTRKQKQLYLNREGIQVIHQPAAHSDSDAIVFFRRSDVIVAGDVLDLTRFPVIDVEKGGSVQGEIAALNEIVALAIPPIPLPFQEGGTVVVPGHGRLCEQAEVVEYRDMVTIIRDVIQDLIASGKTLEEVMAAAPARGYTRRYGSSSGSWTTDMFVEAVFKSLKGKS
jgi:glyoxylase-like metal-dependent hydrolase (beta-lactamase superfamily II)